jgi:hypothetical protein
LNLIPSLELTVQKQPTAGQTPKSAKRLIAARKNGSYGGQERASRYDHVILSEWGSWGGQAVLAKYGREYFVALRKRRTSYPKYSDPPVIRPSRRLIAARENGRKGGMRRAERYSSSCLQAMARAGGIATRTRHGNEFFREIRKMRTHYLQGYITRKTKDLLRQEALQHAKTEKDWGIASLWSGIAKTHGG